MDDERSCSSNDEFPDEHASRSESIVLTSIDEDGSVVAIPIML